MHPSAFLKARLFVETYCDAAADGCSVLDVGAKAYHDHESHRSLFPAPRFAYTGLDVEDGPNVDIRVTGYIWHEIADSTFDVVVSSQTFEHNPLFWVTMCEMARVLKPGGRLLVVAPGGGTVHRYPYDCWRFYPDAWLALCNMTGLRLIESYFETDQVFGLIDGGRWRDSAVIAEKPDDPQMDRRLKELVAPYAEQRFALDGAPSIGPCFSRYEAAVQEQARRAPFRRRLKHSMRRFTGYKLRPIFSGA
jgi:SAM-dependent methyltransferase